MSKDILGTKLTNEESEAFAYWISQPEGNTFWNLVIQQRDAAHDKASKPAGSTYSTGVAGKRMIPLAILEAQARENLAMENAYDIILDLREQIKEDYLNK